MANVSKLDKILSNVRKISQNLANHENIGDSSRWLAVERDVLALELSILSQMASERSEDSSKKAPKIIEAEEEIMSVIESRPGVTQNELCEHFRKMSSRTVRRHIDNLLSRGVVQKTRKGKETAYTL